MAQLSAATMSVPEIEQFLGLTGGRLDALDANSTPSSGTAMRCLDSIRLEAGQSIWFDVFFDPPTDANPFGSQRINDFAVFTISVGGYTTAVKFADAISVGREGASGWESLRYTAGVSGDYIFGFAVLNDGYIGGPSRLFVDSVRSADTSGFTFIQRGATVDALGGALQVLAAAPSAVADEFYALADQPLFLNILANDRDPDPFDAIRLVGVDTAGTRGSTDAFRYVIDGGNGIQATGTVTVRVVGVNDAPAARTDWTVANEGGAVVLVAALANDDDIDLDDGPSSLRIVFARSANGATTVVPGVAGMGFFYHSGAAFDWLAVGETAIDTVTDPS